MFKIIKNIIKKFKGRKAPKPEAKYVNPYQNFIKIDEYPSDIANRVKFDFPNNYKEVEFELNWFLNRNVHCRHPRFLRCILGYAKSDMNRLRKAMKLGDLDYRDLIMIAEYKTGKNSEPIRIRDYNIEFGKERLK